MLEQRRKNRPRAVSVRSDHAQIMCKSIIKPSVKVFVKKFLKKIGVHHQNGRNWVVSLEAGKLRGQREAKWGSNGKRAWL